MTATNAFLHPHSSDENKKDRLPVYMMVVKMVLNLIHQYFTVRGEELCVLLKSTFFLRRSNTLTIHKTLKDQHFGTERCKYLKILLFSC